MFVREAFTQKRLPYICLFRGRCLAADLQTTIYLIVSTQDAGPGEQILKYRNEADIFSWCSPVMAYFVRYVSKFR
jgi:hypothetical protein